MATKKERLFSQLLMWGVGVFFSLLLVLAVSFLQDFSVASSSGVPTVNALSGSIRLYTPVLNTVMFLTGLLLFWLLIIVVNNFRQTD